MQSSTNCVITVLLFLREITNRLYAHAQKGFDIISNWLLTNYLTLNADITQYISFIMQNINITMPDLNIYAQNCSTSADIAFPTLVNADNVKYLAVTIDKSLNCRKHINLLCSRVRQ